MDPTRQELKTTFVDMGTVRLAHPSHIGIGENRAKGTVPTAAHQENQRFLDLLRNQSPSAKVVDEHDERALPRCGDERTSVR